MTRTVLITGANRGIGFETARRLAALGLRVVLTGRGESELKAAAAELRGGGEILTQKMDVSREEDVKACAGSLARLGIQVDVLINNAAIYPGGTVLDAASSDLRECFETNFFGPLWTCRAFVPGMVERGYGRVVNVTSGYGLFSEGLNGPAPYSLSKAALGALTLKLASEAKAPDLKINAVCPGWVRTRMGGSAAPRPVEKGAETVVWLATLPESGPTGKVFRDQRSLAW